MVEELENMDDYNEDEREEGIEETADTPLPTMPHDNLSGIIIILTSVFLLMSIIIIAIRLYTAYDLWK